MSYDVWTVPLDADREEGPAVGGIDWNYTYNIQPMTAKAGLRSLNDLDGVPTDVAALALTTVIERMEADPEGYQALNPSNRWGDYAGFLYALKELRDGLLDVTNSKVRVC